jgi:hypothetical protein
LAEGFAKVDADPARVNRLPWPLSEAASLIPGSGFDLREALNIHAAGLARAAHADASVSPRARAFALSAEMLLLQHTCHWFCKSRAVASARMMVRHQTSYALLLQSVSPETRRTYGALSGAV